MLVTAELNPLWVTWELNPEEAVHVILRAAAPYYETSPFHDDLLKQREKPEQRQEWKQEPRLYVVQEQERDQDHTLLVYYLRVKQKTY